MTKIEFIYPITETWDYPKISQVNNNYGQGYHDFLNSHTEGNEIRIYIHIPFCNSFCLFCQFYKEPFPKNTGIIASYLESLLKELSFYSTKEYFSNKTVSTIYFGGGDPAILSGEDITDIIRYIRQSFNVSDDVEVSMEGNVKNLLDKHKLQVLKDAGVTRLSFGVQTFNEYVRKKLLLKPSLKDIDDLVALLNIYFPNRFTIDLMYNLPEQSYEILRDDLYRAISYQAQYIDIYNLNIYPNTVFYDRVLYRDEYTIKPTKEREKEMVEMINSFFLEKGYNIVLSCTYSKTEKLPNKALYHYLRGG